MRLKDDRTPMYMCDIVVLKSDQGEIKSLISVQVGMLDSQKSILQEYELDA